MIVFHRKSREPEGVVQGVDEGVRKRRIKLEREVWEYCDDRDEQLNPQNEETAPLLPTLHPHP